MKQNLKKIKKVKAKLKSGKKFAKAYNLDEGPPSRLGTAGLIPFNSS